MNYRIDIYLSGKIRSLAYLLHYRAISEYYRDYVYPWTVPILLPVAQISLTASVYTTVVTCFDRYVAICRPALLGKIISN